MEAAVGRPPRADAGGVGVSARIEKGIDETKGWTAVNRSKQSMS